MKAGAAAFLILALLTFIYLMPGSQDLFAGRTDRVMSDGTDPAALPYIYDQIVQVWHQHPSRLFYGSVYLEPPDPERGLSSWTPWSERWIVVAAAPFFPIEQLSTAVVFVLLLGNGLALFVLGRYLGWKFPIALGLAIAWAFNPFTRARAKVHMAMAGTYHLPLIFLALFLVARGKSWRSLLAASFALVLACTTVHYFVVTSLFLTPLFLLFFALQPEVRAQTKRALGRLSLAAIPAVLFLGLNFAFPVPSDVKISAKDSMPRSGDTYDGGLHPFLTRYAAQPIDYFAGDIALTEGPKDLNPLREMVNSTVLNHLEGSNPHERSNGVRWSIWALAALALWFAFQQRPQKLDVYFWLTMVIFGIWLSLSPDVLLPHSGPSGWLYTLVNQIRVPSRAGILPHFALLMLAGLWLASRTTKKWPWWPWLIPALMLVDYPPGVQEMPEVPLAPAFRELQREQGACGAGLYFPFVSNYHVNVLHYIFLQQMRGSDCGILNGMVNPSRILAPAQAFPVTMEFLSGLEQNLVASEQLTKLARCVPLTWIVFDSHTPKAWRERTCASLGWQMTPQLVCVSPQKGRPLERFPDSCFSGS